MGDFALAELSPLSYMILVSKPDFDEHLLFQIPATESDLAERVQSAVRSRLIISGIRGPDPNTLMAGKDAVQRYVLGRSNAKAGEARTKG